MRTLLCAMTIAGVVTLGLPGAAAAQDPAPPAPKTMKPTVEAIIGALDRTAASLKAFEAKKEFAAKDIQVVIVDEVLMPETAAASFDEAVQRNAEALKRVRLALAGHETITGVLKQSEITTEQVVAFDVPETGGIVLFVRKGT